MITYFIGNSMKPILQPGDVLEVIHYKNNKVNTGDVIVFRPPGCHHNVIHRVIAVDPQKGIRTCGDNNKSPDSYFLNFDDILGRVIYAKRKNKQIYIHGGVSGILIRITVKAVSKIKSAVSSLLRPAYHWLGRTGIMRRYLPARMETRVLSFKRFNGTERQLLMGRYIIGRCLPGRDTWQIRRPFRLFVDESALP